MATSSNGSTFAHLQQVFPGKVLLDSHEAASALNISFKTLNNAGSNFVIPAVKFGRRKYFRILDIAAYVDGALGIAVPSVMLQSSTSSASAREPVSARQKRGRGRPPKAQAKTAKVAA